ncbi:MAG TPA: hypothetical protein VFQ38_13015, partial [Longimicrobiales bacterium]|nr:hypothetical protein [Longimicrobiales bacterium]
MRDPEEQHLIEKPRKVEALFARPATAGERGAAEGARDRIRERLRGLASVAAPVEFRFTLLDDWST